MPRTRYFRKRPTHSAWIASLWVALHPFLEPSSPDAARSDTSGLHGLSPSQVHELRGMLASLGEQFRIGLNVDQLPDTLPGFFAIGSEMPASRIGRPSPRLQHFLKRKGRPRKSSPRPLRPTQAGVDAWMLGRAEFARPGRTHAKRGIGRGGVHGGHQCVAVAGPCRILAPAASSSSPARAARSLGAASRTRSKYVMGGTQSA
jgi:hypothetical protein